MEDLWLADGKDVVGRFTVIQQTQPPYSGVLWSSVSNDGKMSVGAAPNKTVSFIERSELEPNSTQQF